MRANIVTINAIVAITALEIVAMTQGINGYLLGLAIAAIAGLAGFRFGKQSASHLTTGVLRQETPKTPPSNDPPA